MERLEQVLQEEERKEGVTDPVEFSRQLPGRAEKVQERRIPREQSE